MKSAGVPWRVSFRGPEADWEAGSLLELRRADPHSWQRFLKLFGRFSELPPDGDPGCVALARGLAWWYAERMPRRIAESVQSLSAEWESLHEPWMRFLDGLFGRARPTSEPVTCLASLSLLSPRRLDTREFSVPFYVAPSRQLYICAHETLHLRYFEWLGRAHPEIPRGHYEHPHHAWRVSEVVAGVVAHDPLAVELFGPGPDECYACTKPVFDRALAAWKAHRLSGEEFERFYAEACGVVPATEEYQ